MSKIKTESDQNHFRNMYKFILCIFFLTVHGRRKSPHEFYVLQLQIFFEKK